MTSRLSRRTLIKSAAGSAVLAGVGMPAIVRAQADTIRIGHLTPLTGFLAKNPKGGQHHVCFEVEDILAARDAMRAKGCTILGTGEPRIGAHGTPVIFVHPKDMGGVLVELMETPKSAH